MGAGKREVAGLGLPTPSSPQVGTGGVECMHRLPQRGVQEEPGFLPLGYCPHFAVRSPSNTPSNLTAGSTETKQCNIPRSLEAGAETHMPRALDGARHCAFLEASQALEPRSSLWQ